MTDSGALYRNSARKRSFGAKAIVAERPSTFCIRSWPMPQPKSDTTASHFSKGDKVLWVRRIEDDEPQEVAIESVGRKWITIAMGWREGRFHIDTLEVDVNCNRSYGRLFRSRSDYLKAKKAHEEGVEADICWGKLKTGLHNLWRRPDTLKASTIEEAMKLLGIKSGGAS
jgi:hypothetical protein